MRGSRMKIPIARPRRSVLHERDPDPLLLGIRPLLLLEQRTPRDDEVLAAFPVLLCHFTKSSRPTSPARAPAGASGDPPAPPANVARKKGAAPRARATRRSRPWPASGLCTFRGVISVEVPLLSCPTGAHFPHVLKSFRHCSYCARLSGPVVSHGGFVSRDRRCQTLWIIWAGWERVWRVSAEDPGVARGSGHPVNGA